MPAIPKPTAHFGFPAWKDVSLTDVKLAYLDPRLDPRWIKGKDSQDLDLIDLWIACDYVVTSPASQLGKDELEEFLECVDLLIQRDPSFVSWCKIQANKRDRLAVEWNSGKRDLRKDLQDMFVRAFIATTEWMPPYPFLTQQKLGNELVRSIGFLDILTQDGRPKVDIEFIQAKLMNGEDISESIPCLLQKPSWYETEDILDLKCRLAAIPSMLLGRLLSDGKLQLYAAITLPDTYRLDQWYYPFHFKQIARNAKSPLDQQFPFSNWPQDKSEACQQVLEAVRQVDQPEDLALALGRLGKIWTTANVSGSVEIPLEQLGQKDSINSATFLALVLHMLCRLSLDQEFPIVQPKLNFELGLLRKPTSQAVPPLESPAGNHFCLILRDDLANRQIVLTDTAEIARGEDIANDLTYRLGFHLPYCCSSSSSAPLQKYIRQGQTDYRGDAVGGNLLSCVAFACIGGGLRPEIKQVLQSSAVLIPLEDRHKRTAKLPELWQSNLRKLMEIVVSNPNIRHLVVFGETIYCDWTIDYLHRWTKGERKALPPEYFPHELVDRFHQQINPETLKIVEGNTSTDIDLVWQLKNIVDASFLDRIPDDPHSLIRETACLPLGSWVTETQMDRENRNPLIPRLLRLNR